MIKVSSIAVSAEGPGHSSTAYAALVIPSLTRTAFAGDSTIPSPATRRLTWCSQTFLAFITHCYDKAHCYSNRVNE
jgi:hypothetical protein